MIFSSRTKSWLGTVALGKVNRRWVREKSIRKNWISVPAWPIVKLSSATKVKLRFFCACVNQFSHHHSKIELPFVFKSVFVTGTFLIRNWLTIPLNIKNCMWNTWTSSLECSPRMDEDGVKLTGFQLAGTMFQWGSCWFLSRLLWHFLASAFRGSNYWWCSNWFPT